MGPRTIADFFLFSEVEYLARNLLVGDEYVANYAAVPALLKLELNERYRNGDLNEKESSGLPSDDLIESMYDQEGILLNSEIMVLVFGSDWILSLPEKLNPELKKLMGIVPVVQAGIRMFLGKQIAVKK